MVFNKFWTKEDNDLMRKMIKENKSVDEIREFFGNDKLFYHPKRKYYTDGKVGCLPNFNERKQIQDFTGFVNEIKYSELKTDFRIIATSSLKFKNEVDYHYTFLTNSLNRYIVDFIYLKDTKGNFKDKDLYNVSFTLEKNYDLNDYKKYETETNLNEQHEIIKRLIYIIKDFHKKYSNGCIYLIGETEEMIKINWYINLVKDSFEEVNIIKDESSFTNDLPAYYFEVVKF
jgi:hypothetical protein